MSPISSLILPPFSAVFAAITRARLAAYERGLFQVTKLDVPVISIGNITTGGTGKTPLVEWVSRALAREGRNVCILSRGYGRPNSTARVVVSDGKEVLADAAASGDEPFMLAENLRGVAAVISDPDRISAGNWAIENLKSDVFVLDDGFQHLRLARDLNILAIDATNPWGGGHLLPYGRMRESRRGLSRADCIVVTRTEQSDSLSKLQAEIRESNGTAPVFLSRMQSTGFRRVTYYTPGQLESLPQPAGAFCAVGNPKAFFDQLRKEQVEVTFSRAFPDHHRYDQTDIDSIVQEANRVGAVSLVTTAKDTVKLRAFNSKLPLFSMGIEISIEDEAQLIQMIHFAVSRT